MGISFNGATIDEVNGDVVFNGASVASVVFNGATVWEKKTGDDEPEEEKPKEGVPNTPTGLEVVSYQKYIDVSWTPVNCVDYTVLRNGVYYKQVSEPYFRDRNVDKGGYYEYQIIANNEIGGSNPSEKKGVGCEHYYGMITVPGVEAKDNCINVLINEPRSNESFVLIRKRVNGNDYWGYFLRVDDLVPYIDEDGNKYFSFKDYEIFDNTYVDYSATLFNGSKKVYSEHFYGAQVEITQAPSDFTLSYRQDNGVIFLEWNRCTNFVEKYRVYKDDVLITETIDDKFIDVVINPNTTYKYRVEAINNIGSSVSNTITVTSLEYTGLNKVYDIQVTPKNSVCEISFEYDYEFDYFLVFKNGELVKQITDKTFTLSVKSKMDSNDVFLDKVVIIPVKDGIQHLPSEQIDVQGEMATDITAVKNLRLDSSGGDLANCIYLEWDKVDYDSRYMVFMSYDENPDENSEIYVTTTSDNKIAIYNPSTTDGCYYWISTIDVDGHTLLNSDKIQVISDVTGEDSYYDFSAISLNNHIKLNWKVDRNEDYPTITEIIINNKIVKAIDFNDEEYKVGNFEFEVDIFDLNFELDKKLEIFLLSRGASGNSVNAHIPICIDYKKTTFNKLTRPYSVKASIEEFTNAINIVWGEVENADYYKIYYKRKDDNEYTFLARTYHTGFFHFTDYEDEISYRVIAFNEYEQSEDSFVVTGKIATKAEFVPSKPIIDVSDIRSGLVKIDIKNIDNTARTIELYKDGKLINYAIKLDDVYTYLLNVEGIVDSQLVVFAANSNGKSYGSETIFTSYSYDYHRPFVPVNLTDNPKPNGRINVIAEVTDSVNNIDCNIKPLFLSASYWEDHIYHPYDYVQIFDDNTTFEVSFKAAENQDKEIVTDLQIKTENVFKTNIGAEGGNNYSYTEPTDVPEPLKELNASRYGFTDKIRLTWEETFEDKFVVFRKYFGSSYIQVAEVSDNYYDDFDVTKDVEYTYKVYPVNDIGRATSSPEVVGVAGDIAESTPETPSNIYASDGLYENEIYVSWSYVSNAIYYELFRRDEDGEFELLYKTKDNTTSYFDKDVETGGKKYYYKVRACNKLGNSDFSYETSGYTKVPEEHLPPQDTIYDLSADGDDDLKIITLTWTSTLENADGVIVFRDGIEIARVNQYSYDGKYIDEDVTPNIEHTYCLKLFNQYGSGECSNTATASYNDDFKITPCQIAPQGHESCLDADMVDGMHFDDLKNYFYSPDNPQDSPTYWGNILGTLADQLDLKDALDAKANTSGDTFTGNVTLQDSAQLHFNYGANDAWIRQQSDGVFKITSHYHYIVFLDDSIHTDTGKILTSGNHGTWNWDGSVLRITIPDSNEG